MWILLIVLLLIWAAVSVVGFIVKGLIWLAIVGIVLFIATVVFGMLRRGATTRE